MSEREAVLAVVVAAFMEGMAKAKAEGMEVEVRFIAQPDGVLQPRLKTYYGEKDANARIAR